MTQFEAYRTAKEEGTRAHAEAARNVTNFTDGLLEEVCVVSVVFVVSMVLINSLVYPT
jgi:hypothetical protein